MAAGGDVTAVLERPIAVAFLAVALLALIWPVLLTPACAARDVISVDGAAARDIEHRAGRERAVLRGQPGNHRGDFLNQHKAVHRDLGQHVVDVFLLHLSEHFRLRRRRRDAIHQDFLVASSLASDLVSPISPAFEARIVRRVRIALLAGDRGNVDDPPVTAAIMCGTTARQVR